jgi:hypothetical protein
MMDMSRVIGTLQAMLISVREGDISMDMGASIPMSIPRTRRMEDELLRLADLNLSQPHLTESLPRAYIEYHHLTTLRGLRLTFLPVDVFTSPFVSTIY